MWHLKSPFIKLEVKNWADQRRDFALENCYDSQPVFLGSKLEG